MSQISGKTPEQKWWKEAIVYQIYPSSFLDTDADGIGNINGIITKLDYLKELGVDILWVSPIYESPHKDMGYDISNYRGIHRPYGVMDDVHRLINELKQRDMKLIMDLVVNHTSNQHPWFIDSASSTVSSRRDWYIWRKPKYDAEGNRHPPNNWCSLFDEMESAWTYDSKTDEYYLSLFSPFQADLNWETSFVREEVNDIMRFWLDKGVSGFRMDVINLISKDQMFPDAEIRHPGRKYQPAECYFANGIRLMDYLQGMKDAVFSKYDTLTVGEMPFLEDEKQRLKMVEEEEGVLNMIFTFEMMGLDIVPEKGRFSNKPWTVDEMKKIIAKSCKIIAKNGWHTLFCENHDQPRSVTRFCDDSDEHRVAGTKLLSIMQTSLPGTLYLYQGEELGMRNVPKSWTPDEYKDIESVKYWKNVCAQFEEGSAERKEAKHFLRLKARDNARTPMQWDSTSNGGFCPPGVKPWMRVNDDYPIVNAALQTSAGRANDRTMLVSPYRFWQRSIETRKRHADLLVYGEFDIIDNTHPNIFAFKRTTNEERSITILNFSKDEVDFTLPEGQGVKHWAMGSYDALSMEKPKTGVVHLLPWEGLLGIA
ncbi:glycoside hydrolase family 13 [Fusarium beomiforme]|uniref:Glycoside hydrolase family 13 n=1 Tax=Fusarium beomiforme TaxID=44412 RepID=A0A9P5AFW0_9HYPO|nr:glycoside hydrolase family 13 [Fusarium beomiforme]